ncbi:flagella assembly protein FlgT middle domain-containing protein [Vreelandella utahensis]|uniref:flagella assembly protein FlgT middle domain-containing protein n=1 Tax=Vreelandella halophila TaxID=86177 RepID=UPI0009842ADD|nr:flagella assembly protein FlgT middle domain-containing protein [Halomonas utahensis]
MKRGVLGCLMGVMVAWPLAGTGAEKPAGLEEKPVQVHFPERLRPQPAVSWLGGPGKGGGGGAETSSGARQVALVPRETGNPARSRDNLRRLQTAPSLQEGSSCPGRDTSRFRKSVAITRFPLMDSDGAVLGRLDNVVEALPRMLSAELSPRETILMHSAFDRRLYDRPLNAPTVQAVDRNLTRASELTRAMGVQFVISGVVRDIGVEDPEAWGTSTASWLGRGLGVSNQQRRLAVDLFVYDGLSGVMVMSDRLEVRGEWDHAREAEVGFGTPAFAETDFGQRIGQRVSNLADEVAVNLGCQPFIASVERVDNERIRISAGADSGLRPGQTMELLRAERYLDQPQDYPALRPTGQTMEVQQVQPRFSSGQLPVEGGRINVQRGDRVVIW